MGHWHAGLQGGESHLTVRSFGKICFRCYEPPRKVGNICNHSCTLEVKRYSYLSIYVYQDGSSQDLKPRICAECGKDCNIDNCYVNANRSKSRFHTHCKDCERLKRVPVDHQHTYLQRWWRTGSRESYFKNSIEAQGFVLTIYLHSTCVGVPKLSSRDIAHLELQAQGSASVDWYDDEPLTFGDPDPTKRFSMDRITSGSDKKMFPYNHPRLCTVAASHWKNE